MKKKVALRDVRREGGNRYCGPAVISAVTGFTTNKAAAMIRAYSGQRFVKGSHTSDVLRVMRDMGVRHSYVPGSGDLQRTMIRWIEDEAKLDTTYLIVAGHHFQLYRNHSFVDSQTGEVVGITHPKVGRRRRMECAYMLWREDDED